MKNENVNTGNENKTPNQTPSNQNHHDTEKEGTPTTSRGDENAEEENGPDAENQSPVSENEGEVDSIKTPGEVKKTAQPDPVWAADRNKNTG